MRNNQIGTFVNKALQPTIEKKGVLLLNIIESWQYIVPKNLYHEINPIKITWKDNNKGVLYVKINNHLLISLFIHQKEIIINRLNSYLGYYCIEDIKLKK